MLARALAWLVACIACAALGAGCTGPYPNLGEKLDLTTQIGVNQTSWLLDEAASTRVLVLGALAAGAQEAPFMLATVTKHGDATVRSGGYRLDGPAGLTLFADLEQQRLNEAGTPVASQRGSTRKNLNDRYDLTARVDGPKLALTGDPRLAGAWHGLLDALGQLAPNDRAAAECALRLHQVQVLVSQARVPAFGGGGSIQYTTPATFQGVVAGSLRVQLFGLFNPRTELTYTGFSDFGGVAFDRQIITQTNTAGDGHLFGTLDLTFARPGEAAPLLACALTYGREDGAGDSLQLAGGVVTGGNYHLLLAGGTELVFAYTTILERNTLEGCLDSP